MGLRKAYLLTHMLKLVCIFFVKAGDCAFAPRLNLRLADYPHACVGATAAPPPNLIETLSGKGKKLLPGGERDRWADLATSCARPPATWHITETSLSSPFRESLHSHTFSRRDCEMEGGPVTKTPCVNVCCQCNVDCL